MMTNAALTFKAALSLLAACLLFLASPAAAQTVPASREGREVLSVSWQKGYCAARPRSRGCADFSANAPAARQFSLLSRFQVRKSYCGIEAALKQRARKGKWTELPDIVLASVTKERLMAAMPAARLGLDRQQWLRSGSCVAVSPEIYYSRSLDLLDTLNASPVLALFSQKAGAAVTLAEVRAAFDADRLARFEGKEPAMIPVTWEADPAEPCALPTTDTHDFFLGPMRERATTWRNEVTLRSVEMFLDYEPGAYLPLISPTPLLLVVAGQDHLTPADLTLAAFEDAREPKKLVVLPCGHFEAYVDEGFAVGGAAERDWFA
ncbi:MAG: hypothetical protein LCH99_19485, partial [Proteobacteria bacterium]|nr:hypothetical protein [Pseudomonadota bacterium]